MRICNCAPATFTIFAMLYASVSYAQTCDSEIPSDSIATLFERQILGLYDLPHEFVGLSHEIKIKWHVVTSESGDRAIDNATLDYYAMELDRAFRDAGLRFCADPDVHLIVDDALFANVSSHYNLRMIEPSTNAIDIYWCNSLQNGGLCGTSSYTVSPIQGIVMQTTCMGYPDVHGVLIHEVGHYFDLYHTHENGFGFECAEGSDCETTGDHVCDTNPSPNLSFDECIDPIDCSLIESNSACTDAPGPPLCLEGQTYNPDTDNYMGYIPVPCLNRLTAGQLARARATFLNFRQELHAFSCQVSSDCIGDIDQNGVINSTDITILLGNWLAIDHPADLNGDGIVSGGDLSIVLANWSSCN